MCCGCLLDILETADELLVGFAESVVGIDALHGPPFHKSEKQVAELLVGA